MSEVESVKFLLNFIQAGSKVLSARFTMLLALVLTFILFAWAMAKTDVLQVGIATIFACLVFLPSVWLDIDSRKERAAKGE